MTRILAALPLLVVSLVAYAVDVPEPPVESNVIGTVVFILLFVGGIAAFGWMVWRNEKKSKQGKS